MAKITAPFTAEQVVYLEIWQAGIGVHPFTCLHDHEGDKNLVPTETGWACPQCSYEQYWCHDFMCESRPNVPISSWIQCELAKQQINTLSKMYSDWVAAKSITPDPNPDARGLILRKEIFKLRTRIDEYEFSSRSTPSSKEDLSTTEGNGD